MKKQLLKTAFCLMALAIGNNAKAQVTLVEAPGVASQDVARISTVGNKLFFTGREEGGSSFNVYLWSNDGSTSTRILLLGQVAQNINPSYFVPCNGKAFFFYSDGASVSGYEPWVSDGTAAGTFMIRDINPGSSNSVISNGTQTCTCYNNKIYFAADNGTNGSELWVSDGTSAGTTLVKDIKAGSAGSAITAMVEYKNELYFTAKTGSYAELWHTDGTTAGTVRIPNPSTLNSYQSEVLVHDTLLFFSGKNSGSAGDLAIWKTNGTTLGTAVITGSLPSTPLTALWPLVNLGSDVLFGYQYYSAGYAYRLYKTDGTSITMVKDSLNFKNPVKLGNKIVFKGEVTGSATNGEPWVTDGTTAGTFKLNPVSWITAGTFRNNSLEFNNKIYFASGTTLWETDGTVAGTAQNTSGVGSIFDFAEMNGTLYLNWLNAANNNRAELFKLGTSTGLKEHQEALGIALYPQPASGKVTLLFEQKESNVDVRITDIAGKVLLAEKLTVTGNSADVNLDGIADGIYLLHIKTASGRSTAKKIIVAR